MSADAVVAAHVAGAIASLGPGWHQLHVRPKKVRRGLIDPARAKYLSWRSRERYLRDPQRRALNDELGAALKKGALGLFDGVIIVES